MKYTVTLSDGPALSIEAESFHGQASLGLVVFIDGIKGLPVAALQAHQIQRITTDAVTVNEESK